VRAVASWVADVAVTVLTVFVTVLAAFAEVNESALVAAALAVAVLVDCVTSTFLEDPDFKKFDIPKLLGACKVGINLVKVLLLSVCVAAAGIDAAVAAVVEGTEVDEGTGELEEIAAVLVSEAPTAPEVPAEAADIERKQALHTRTGTVFLICGSGTR
jgi:hypothetical protein